MASDEARLKAIEFGKSHYKEYRNFSEATCLQDGYEAGYTQGRADALEGLTNDQLYKDGYNNGFMEGRAGALKELEQLQREAFEFAVNRLVYGHASCKVGYGCAVITPVYNDYLSSKSKEAK